MLYLLLALIAGVWALRFAARKARWVRQQDPGTEPMREIAPARAAAHRRRRHRRLDRRHARVRAEEGGDPQRAA